MKKELLMRSKISIIQGNLRFDEADIVLKGDLECQIDNLVSDSLRYFAFCNMFFDLCLERFC